MGEMYKCHCNKCGYEEDFRVGGGFCTDEYWEETRMLEARLKEEVLSGKYGNQLKNIIESDLHNFQFSYDDDILQCLNCLKFSIVRKPEIRYFHLKQFAQFVKKLKLKLIILEIGISKPSCKPTLAAQK